ncbi:MAG: M16 family metallopeptidase [Polyangiaceae bacterium]|jgi:zinc protease
MKPALRLSFFYMGMVLAACGAEAPAAPAPSLAPPAASVPSPASPTSDVLGPKPLTPPSPPFLPPSPTVDVASGGITLWLLERHEVPIVSCDMTVPTGASSDPKGKAGLAYATTRMLEEGAGARGAIELARAIDDLGAHLTTDANADASFVSVTVLKRNLDRAFSIFGDVVTKPRFERAEYKRMTDLWFNELLERQKDPDATARVVYRVALFGPDHPYGHPWDGTVKSARALTLEDVRRFYSDAWRPDRAILVCAGDVTKEELMPLVQAAFSTWKAPASVALPPLVPPAPKGPWPKVVFVDRPDAPQSVIAALRPGLAASDPRGAALWRVNDAIGGSFTSRLNQDLRERHGYTYGARSRFSVSRGPGQVVSWANVVTDKTGDALDAMLGDLRKFADEGMSDDEVDRTRSQARGELVSVYESVEGIAGHLAADASLGLPPDWQAKVSERREAAQRTDLDALAKEFYGPDGAIIVVVGPRSRVQPMLDKLKMPTPETMDSEGNVVRSPLTQGRMLSP